VGSSELGPIYRRTGHPSSCRPRHTDRVVGRRSEEPPLTARIRRRHTTATLSAVQAHRGNRRFQGRVARAPIETVDASSFRCESASHRDNHRFACSGTAISGAAMSTDRSSVSRSRCAPTAYRRALAPGARSRLRNKARFRESHPTGAQGCWYPGDRVAIQGAFRDDPGGQADR
jgi:hypothetical protein